MKLLAFNGSPRKQGMTSKVLSHLLTGAKEAGAQVAFVHLSDKRITPCTGEFNCWVSTPGACTHQDDMTEILNSIRSSEILVFGTPVYVDGITAQLKALLDRCIPLVEPFFEIRDGHCRHPTRDKRRWKAALVAVSGFSEPDNFEPMIIHFKALLKNLGADFAGALIRPAAWILPTVEKTEPEKARAVYAAIRNAGHELVTSGRFSEETCRVAMQELVPPERLVEIANSMWRHQIDKISIEIGRKSILCAGLYPFVTPIGTTRHTLVAMPTWWLTSATRSTSL